MTDAKHAPTPRAGQLWILKVIGGEPQRIERVDGDGRVWIRSFAFVIGFPAAKFLEMYEPRSAD